MKLVIFGLTVSSSWGNDHATLWRGLIRALGHAGHCVVLFERDVPYYAAHRDLAALDHVPGAVLRLYRDWKEARVAAASHLQDCDAAMVTSYCPDGAAASEPVLASRAPVRVFYDLDAPVTLERLRAGQDVDHLPPDGLGGFDLVLSFTGGDALAELRVRLGARRVAPLYGHVDPEIHRPPDDAPPREFALSCLGTCAADRQEALDRLCFAAARARPDLKFVLGGSMYPQDLVPAAEERGRRRARSAPARPRARPGPPSAGRAERRRAG